MVGGVFSAGAQMVMQNAGFAHDNHMAERQRQWQLEDRAHQEKYQEEWWNKVNEYNLPIHQMERIRQAGINPALAFGNAAPSSMAASSPKPISKGPFPRVPNPYQQNLIETALSAQSMQLNNEKTKEEIRAKELANHQFEAMTEMNVKLLEAKLKNLQEQNNYWWGPNGFKSVEKALAEHQRDNWILRNKMDKLRNRNYGIFGTDRLPWAVGLGSDIILPTYQAERENLRSMFSDFFSNMKNSISSLYQTGSDIMSNPDTKKAALNLLNPSNASMYLYLLTH